ncbi:MAG: hypothetical protein HN356_03835 [Calditrichaeota bacterium]|nr:hypothetical protein [Calditrichota bacterium]MBT7615923.1 hypothetical protein [Calditrichota bacterium]MBT7789721.1 hypothetical protein [Calditrichota bacterium]
MFQTTKEIVKPENLADAQSLYEPGTKVYLSGGSYISEDIHPELETLIDINHLMDCEIKENEDHLYVGAGATFQQLIEYLEPEGLQGQVAECAEMSCPQKNLRNQRTIGGEAAFGRTNSDFILCLHALNVTLVFAGENNSKVPIRNWDDKGIITGIEIPLNPECRFDVQRFAIGPADQAFIIISGMKVGEHIDISTGGEAFGVASIAITTELFTDAFIEDISADIAGLYFEDHFGSQEFKRGLIKSGMKLVRTNLG